MAPLDGQRPMDVIAASTPKDVVLQFDVGTCLEVGADPIAWINANPGRIKSVHCKDWAPGKGYDVAFGEGDAPWKADLRRRREATGGVEYYLIEQETGANSIGELPMVQRCLENWKKLRRLPMARACQSGELGVRRRGNRSFSSETWFAKSCSVSCLDHRRLGDHPRASSDEPARRALDCVGGAGLRRDGARRAA